MVLKVIIAILALILTVKTANKITLIVILAILDMANHPVQVCVRPVRTTAAQNVLMTLLSVILANTGTDKIPTKVEVVNPAMMYNVVIV